MRKQNAKLVKYCSKIEHVYERNLKRITDEEVDKLLEMVKEYGKDFEYISSEMKAKFKKDLFQPIYCRSIWQRYSNDFNWEQMTPKEFERVYNNYKMGVFNQKRHIWRKMSLLFKNRPRESLQSRFRESLHHLFRDMISIYALDQFKAYYIIRLTSMSQVSFQMLVYLKEYVPNYWESTDPIFFEIKQACQRFVGWMEKFISIGFQTITNQKFFFTNADILQEVPEITDTDFSTTIELVILLDTLNRVALSQFPYNDQYSHRVPKVEKRQDVHQGQDEIEIKERPHFVPYGNKQFQKIQKDIRRQYQNRTTQPEYYEDKDNRRQKYYYSLSQKQKSMILNSETLERLIPIQTKLDQLSNT